MRPSQVSGFVEADEPIIASTTPDGKNILLTIGEVGQRSYLWITPSHAACLRGQFGRLLAEPTRPAAAIRARVDLMLEDAG